MTPRDQALQVVRLDEQDCVSSLRVGPPQGREAFTRLHISRELYCQIEPPPTRHHVYRVTTFWDAATWQPLRHVIEAQERRQTYRFLSERPGAFGA